MGHHFVTIKDIARTLNVSTSTVSRALRDTYDVNQETKEKVLALAAQLNYRPNSNATGLARGRTHNLGVVLPFITNYYFSTVITGIQEIAYNKGYNIILYVTNDSPERELAILRNLAISSLDGLLISISSSAADCSHFQEIMDHGVPVVFFDRVPEKVATSKVMQDDFNGAFEAVDHLISNGYQKIAYISGPQGLSLTEQRLQGYLHALKKHNIPVNEDWIVYSGFSQECGEEDTQHLLQLKDRPNAIFAANDRKAIGALLTLRQHHIKAGSEFGVVGFTNDPMSAIISPSLTTVAEPAMDIGKTACELLLKHINKKHFQAEQVILPGRLIVRESSGTYHKG
ncbi:MAG TPA: LacI family DNA-binding transcriptional regulator [Chitinophaga sp.]|uniref:LacI family DNA-binding transcriptional regulator n=1 Tax=Chitinophaga sp. TaxID=1869181 RepID=UPI002CA838DF|nr:LacI family DNA-binding transcriptional regulator [Chitinophaga sp.]HVI44801.1 LacI family DNA-binding transcriptional regulator [Chitinophaga sp.]